MRVVVAYESMFGNTREVAQAIAQGFAGANVLVTPIQSLDGTAYDADVLVVGAPAHVRGLPSPRTRQAAMTSVASRGAELEPTARGTGVREWLGQLHSGMTTHIATFDTRMKAPTWLTGHPARTISRVLARHGGSRLVHPESFFVDRHDQLLPGELERARAWGKTLADAAQSSR